MNVNAQPRKRLAIPFDHARLDRLMDEAGIDVVIATSKHNVQYLLGGHRANFFDYMDATGVTRYLPVLVYPKGPPEKAAYIGHRLENFQHQVKPLWTPETQTNTAGSVDAMQKAVDYMRKAGIKTKRIATEFGFLPYDASKVLRAAFPDADWVDALFVLERQRAEEIRRRIEDAEIRVGSGDRLDAGDDRHTPPGMTKDDVVEALRREETNRGLTFEYCLITCGTSMNRAPSDQKWEKGEIMSIDCGGNYHGYIGDICRMAIQGEPDAELNDLLAEIEASSARASRPMRAGAMGREIYAAAEPLVKKSKHHNQSRIPRARHGPGQPRSAAAHRHGPVPYPADDADIPLEAGEVISVETTLKHPARGFIKLEDTVVVTETGHEIYGEGARGWNRAGTAVVTPARPREAGTQCSATRSPLSRVEMTAIENYRVLCVHLAANAVSVSEIVTGYSTPLFQPAQRLGQAREFARRAFADLCQRRRRRNTFSRAHHRHDQRLTGLCVIFQREDVAAHAAVAVIGAPYLLAAGPGDLAFGQFAARLAGIFLQLVGAVERGRIDRRVEIDADAEAVDRRLGRHHRLQHIFVDAAADQDDDVLQPAGIEDGAHFAAPWRPGRRCRCARRGSRCRRPSVSARARPLCARRLRCRRCRSAG